MHEFRLQFKYFILILVHVAMQIFNVAFEGAEFVEAFFLFFSEFVLLLFKHNFFEFAFLKNVS